ncbi:MAG: putative sulfate exporter family transporter [Deltaproteobacteria bacterium]|nr:putative sulfate exporter family transporter [Deltaproteobacteria bacterium]
MSLAPAITRPAARAGRVLVPLGAIAVALPWVSTSVGLLAGVIVALAAGNPYATATARLSRQLLAGAVIGLGASMPLGAVARVGASGALQTTVSVAACLAIGALLARVLRVSRDTGLLVSVGTAICGGSAIAAIAPIVRARPHEVTVALAIVFVLNGCALMIFPPIGHAAGLDAHAFGTWAALAIHDTSSVVGAALAYGGDAVDTATALKLTRALWILPVALAVSARRDRTAAALPRPWFILGFVLASAIVTWIPALRPAGLVVAAVAKRAMVVALFLIGAGLTRAALRQVGVRPLVLGVALWVIVAGTSLVVIAAT